MEYLNNYQARERHKMGLVPIANTHPQKLQKKQASMNNKYSNTNFFVCFHFPFCIKHKPDSETALSIVKQNGTATTKYKKYL